MPHGSRLGTVVYIHGCPGSHRDCKYVVPHLQKYGIRFVGINFPGFGITRGDKRLTYSNEERINYVQGVIDRLELREKLIFVGHSRGSENALKMAVLNKERTQAVVLVNGVCLQPHMGVEPMWAIKILADLCVNPFAALFTRPFVKLVYTMRRVPMTLDLATTSIRTISTVDLPAQKPFIDELNKSHLRSLILFSGSDVLIETPKSRHLASHFDGNKEISCSRGVDEMDSPVWKELNEQLRSGRRSVSVHFAREDHFLQKRRATFLAQALLSLCLSSIAARKPTE